MTGGLVTKEEVLAEAFKAANRGRLKAHSAEGHAAVAEAYARIAQAMGPGDAFIGSVR